MCECLCFTHTHLLQSSLIMVVMSSLGILIKRAVKTPRCQTQIWKVGGAKCTRVSNKSQTRKVSAWIFIIVMWWAPAMSLQRGDLTQTHTHTVTFSRMNDWLRPALKCRLSNHSVSSASSNNCHALLKWLKCICFRLSTFSGWFCGFGAGYGSTLCTCNSFEITIETTWRRSSRGRGLEKGSIV